MDNTTAEKSGIANSSMTITSNSTEAKPMAGMSFSDWKKKNCKVRRSMPSSVPSLSFPHEGGAAIVKVAPPVRPPPPKPLQHNFRRPPIPKDHIGPFNLLPPCNPMSIMGPSQFSGTGWQPSLLNPINPFKNNCQMFPMQQMPRMPNSRPKQQFRGPPPRQRQRPKSNKAPAPIPTPIVKPKDVTPSPQQLLMPPPPPPPPLPQTQTEKSQVTASNQPKTEKKKRQLTPWRPMPQMPPPMIATTPESKEEKQRLWRQYRQAMKPFKNHEFLNAKRVIQRLGKKNIDELDERSLGRLLRAQEFVAAHKQKVAEKATDCWVRAMEEEAQNATNGDAQTESKDTASSTSKTPAQIYVRKPGPTWKKPPYVPQQVFGSGRIPQTPHLPPSPASAIMNNALSGHTIAPALPKPPTIYGGRFILGGQLISGSTTTPPATTVSYT